MKKALALSLSLFAVANTLTVNQAHAIDWQNAKKHAVTGLKIAGGLAAVGAIIYCVKNLSFSKSTTVYTGLQMDAYAKSLNETKFGPLSVSSNPFIIAYPIITRANDVVTHNYWTLRHK